LHVILSPLRLASKRQLTGSGIYPVNRHDVCAYRHPISARTEPTAGRV